MFHKVNGCLSTPVDCTVSYSGQLVYSYEIESCWPTLAWSLFNILKLSFAPVIILVILMNVQFWESVYFLKRISYSLSFIVRLYTFY